MRGQTTDMKRRIVAHETRDQRAWIRGGQLFSKECIIMVSSTGGAASREELKGGKLVDILG